MRRLIKSTVYRMAETKFYVQNINVNVSDTTNAELRWLDVINQGSSSTQRIGQKIAVKNISFDLTATYQETNSQFPAEFIRLIVVWPRKGMDTSDLLTYLTASNPGVYARIDPDQYIVLYDQKVMISSRNRGNGMIFRRFRFSKYCKMMNITFDDQTDNVSVQPILYAASTATGVNTLFHNLRGTMSVSYKDI